MIDNLWLKKLGPFLERHTYLTVLQGRLNIEWHTGMTLGEIGAQAATSGECELLKFAFRSIRSVDPSALQPYEGL